MALITMPSSPAFRSSEWGMRSAVAVSESPFTGASSVQSYDKRQWYAVLQLPAMLRDQAAEWQAFFLQLQGRKNTFLLGDPDAKAIRGTATSATTAGSGAIGATVINLTIGIGNTLNKGSYIQFGSGATSRLHMVVDNNTSNGNVIFEPALKSVVTTGATVVISQAKGVFRLDSNDVSWSADHISRYGLTFSCSEVI